MHFDDIFCQTSPFYYICVFFAIFFGIFEKSAFLQYPISFLAFFWVFGKNFAFFLAKIRFCCIFTVKHYCFDRFFPRHFAEYNLDHDIPVLSGFERIARPYIIFCTHRIRAYTRALFYKLRYLGKLVSISLCPLRMMHTLSAYIRCSVTKARGIFRFIRYILLFVYF